MSRLSDRRALGDLPLQDHRPETDVDIHLRAAVYACRIENRDPFGRYIAQGHQKNNDYVPSTNPVKTIGDLLGGHFYEQEEGKREIPAWSFAMPAVLTKPSYPETSGSGGENSSDSPGGGPEMYAPAHLVDPSQVSPADHADPNRTRVRTKGGPAASARTGSMLPVFDEDWTPDERFKSIEASISEGVPALPAGTVGIVLAGTNEREQESLFLPSVQSLVAVNKAGDPRLSSKVYDLTDESELDKDYHAPLHTMMRVCKLASGAGALAWQLGLGGQDSAYGGGLTIDKGSEESAGPTTEHEKAFDRYDPDKTRVRERDDETKERDKDGDGTQTSEPPQMILAYASQHESGCLDVGSLNDQHRVGVTAEGWPINSLHISTFAYFKDNVGDGPLAFEPVSYEPTDPYPFLSEVHLRWDSTIPHKFKAGVGAGKWRWEAEVPFYIPEDDTWIPWDPEREPKPEPYPPLPPLPPESDPPPPYDPTKEYIKKFGGMPFGTTEDELCCLVGQTDDQRREILGGVVSQTHTFSGAFRAAGGMFFRPFATARGQWDLSRGGKPKKEHLFGQRLAPDVAAIVAVGVNSTEGWSGFTDDGVAVQGASRTGPGGLALLPPSYASPDGLSKVLAGGLQPASFAYPWSESTRPTKLFVPGGLASLEFSHPAPSETGQRGGVSVFQDSTGLVIAPRDADGNLTSNTALQITEGSVKVTGKLDVTGLIDPTGLAFDKQSATSIGGSAYGLWASDGTVSGTVNGALYYDDAGTRRRVSAPLKHVATPSANKAGAVALTSHVMSYSGCGLVETSYITSEATAELQASPVASEGQLLSIVSNDANANQFLTVRRYVPDGFTSWATEGVRLRHKVAAVSTAATSVSLTVRHSDGSTAFTIRTVSSADSSYQWLTVAGSALSIWGAGDYIEIQVQLANAPTTENVTVELGRIEFNWL